MSVSYQFSHEHNFSSVLYGASFVAGRLWAWLVIAAFMAIGMCIGAAIIAVVVTFWLPIAQVAGCLCIITLFAVTTYPRSAKPARCSYCKGKNISGGLGHWECNDCGREGSY